MLSGPLVVDASVVAKIYLKDEEFSDAAQDILRRFAAGDLQLVAPQVLLYEVPRAILTATRHKRLDPADSIDLVRDFFSLQIFTVGEPPPLPNTIEAAYEQAQQSGCRLYDAIYLVTADALEYPLVTADRKLFEAAAHLTPQAIWLGDYEIE